MNNIWRQAEHNSTSDDSIFRGAFGHSKSNGENGGQGTQHLGDKGVANTGILFFSFFTSPNLLMRGMN